MSDIPEAAANISSAAGKGSANGAPKSSSGGSSSNAPKNDGANNKNSGNTSAPAGGQNTSDPSGTQNNAPSDSNNSSMNRFNNAANTAYSSMSGSGSDDKIGSGSSMSGETTSATGDMKDAAKGMAATAKAAAQAFTGNFVGAAGTVIKNFKYILKLLAIPLVILLIIVIIVCMLPSMLYSSYVSTLDNVLEDITDESEYYTNASVYGEAFYDMVADLAEYIDALYTQAGIYDEAYAQIENVKSYYEKQDDADNVDISLTVNPDEDSGLVDEDSFVEMLAIYHTVIFLSEEGDTYYGIMWDEDDIAESIAAIEEKVETQTSKIANFFGMIQNAIDAAQTAVDKVYSVIEAQDELLSSWDNPVGKFVYGLWNIGITAVKVKKNAVDSVLGTATITVGSVEYTIEFVVTVANYVGLMAKTELMDYRYRHAFLSSIAACAQNDELFEIGDSDTHVIKSTVDVVTGYSINETSREYSYEYSYPYEYERTYEETYEVLTAIESTDSYKMLIASRGSVWQKWTDNDGNEWWLETWAGNTLIDSDGDGIPNGFYGVYETVTKTVTETVTEIATDTITETLYPTSSTTWTNEDGETFTLDCYEGEEGTVTDEDGDGVPDGYTAVTEEQTWYTGTISVDVTLSTENFMSGAITELKTNHPDTITDEYFDEIVEEEKEYILAEFGDYISEYTFASGSSGTTLGNGIVTSIQEEIVEEALKEDTYGLSSGNCARWVKTVYENVGFSYISGNANDYGRTYCQYNYKDGDDPYSTLQPGMFIATEHSYSDDGKLYGHIGIYIGDGLVLHLGSGVLTDTLEDWITKYYNDSTITCWDGVTREGNLYWGFQDDILEAVNEELESMIVSYGSLPDSISALSTSYSYTACGWDDDEIPSIYFSDGSTATHWSLGSAQRTLLDKYWITQDEDDRYNDYNCAVIDGFYLIACTSTYGDVGDIVVWTLTDGDETYTLNTIIADMKSSGDSTYTIWGHKSGSRYNIIELEMLPKAMGGTGTVTKLPFYGFKVVSWVNYGSYGG